MNKTEHESDFLGFSFCVPFLPVNQTTQRYANRTSLWSRPDLSTFINLRSQSKWWPDFHRNGTNQSGEIYQLTFQVWEIVSFLLRLIRSTFRYGQSRKYNLQNYAFQKFHANFQFSHRRKKFAQMIYYDNLCFWVNEANDVNLREDEKF